MERFFVRTASIVVCAAWAAGCGGHSANDLAMPALPTPSQTVANAPAGDAPVTLEGEIAAAHALRMNGHFADAAKDFGQIMLVAPDHPIVVAEYGKTLLQQGRPADALPFLRRSLELQANNWSVYSAMGVAFDEVGDHTDAKVAYERALSLKPGTPEVLNNFAMSRMLAGDLDGAKQLIAQVSTSSNPKIVANVALLERMKKPGSKGMSEPTPVAEAPLPPISKTPAAGPTGSVAGLTAPKPHTVKSAPVVTAAVQAAPVVRSAPATSQLASVEMAKRAPRVLAQIQSPAPVVRAGVEMETVPVDVLAGPTVNHKPVRHVITHAVKHVTKLAALIVRPAPAKVAPVIRLTMENGATEQTVRPAQPVKAAAAHTAPVKVAQVPMLRLASDE